MPIETPRGLPFSVDTWSHASMLKRHHFLTHAHKDHLSGIAAFCSSIYCTRLTKTLVRRQSPQLEDSLFVEIELGELMVIKDPDGDFSVRAFDANHCPGAVMFLFEGEFGNILHTGDCRLNPECLQNMPLKYANKKGKDCILDYIFLDCTFGRCSIKIPSKKLAIEQVIKGIWKHPNASVVYLACDMLGQEDILVQVSRAFGSKIYVDEIKNPDCFNVLSLMAPEILSKDASCRFQLIEGFPSLNERASKKIAEARANFQPEPLFIRPSTQWYTTNDLEHRLSLSEAVRDECGVWHVCYSMHSSREELEWALQILQPTWVISTTPPCRAMELDYVKKHCYKTRITHDDPIWKLFKGSIAFSATTNSELPRNIDAATAEVSQVSEEFGVVNRKELSVDHLEHKLDFSAPPVAVPITLFGRARLTDQHINILLEERKHCSANSKNIPVVSMQEVGDVHDSWIISEPMDTTESLQTRKQTLSSQDTFVGPNVEKGKDIYTRYVPNKVNHALEQFKGVDEQKCLVDIASTKVSVTAGQNFEYSRDGNASSETDTYYIGSSKNLNVKLRRLYRSMNVPVPCPLPSVVGLMNSIKRIKTVAGSGL
ncbi:protein artemis [Phalaenopsis equestris]|uniref:protein artemis n=1 Tax=Phalaenopsis equestris TaxID=78828 RepID=UPI0009E4E5ED|nr:protein artemis [Phalaenopsis equestris]